MLALLPAEAAINRALNVVRGVVNAAARIPMIPQVAALVAAKDRQVTLRGPLRRTSVRSTSIPG